VNIALLFISVRDKFHYESWYYMPREPTEIIKEVERKNIKYIRFVIVDVFGRPKGVIVRKYTLKDYLTDGVGFDGSSVPGYADIEDSDLVMIPDMDTFIITPWWDRTALMFCHVYKDERPHPHDPRFVLRGVMDKIQKLGYKVGVGVELEFFLVKRIGKEIVPYDRGEYFDYEPLNEGVHFKVRLMEMLESLGFRFEKLHHEVAPGQYEMDFMYDDLLSTADRVILFKLAAKCVAKKMGLIATFMPKPFWGINGSGAHLHLSLHSIDGENLFMLERRSPYRLSSIALSFIAGVLSHARALSAIVSPTVNSYKRLVPGHEAPVYISWGYGNRSTLIRVPVYRTGKAKIEYRHPDPSFNPYLAFASVALAGIDGVERGLRPEDHVDYNVYHRHEGLPCLPETLEEALQELLKDELLVEGLGRSLMEKYIKLRRKEWEDYIEAHGGWEKSRYCITEWEIDRYLELA